MSNMADENDRSDFGTPFAALVAHFESGGLRFFADAGSKSVQLFITGDCAVYNCHLQLTHDDELLQVRIHYPVVVRDVKIRPLVAEALARANHGMPVGRFDFNIDSGEMGFHLGHVLRGRGVDDELVGGAFSTGLSTADRYFSAVMRVMFAGHTPADAVYLSELDLHAETVEAGGSKAASPAFETKPKAKKRRAPRGERRAGATGELPGLFDQIPGQKDGGSQSR